MKDTHPNLPEPPFQDRSAAGKPDTKPTPPDRPGNLPDPRPEPDDPKPDHDLPGSDRPDRGDRPSHPIAPTPAPKPGHRAESPEAHASAAKEAAGAQAVEVPNVAQASFNESQFKDAGGGWVTVQVQSPTPVWYGPGFPLPGAKFNYHGWTNQTGPVRDGVCYLTVKPGGTIAAQPVEEEPGGWQFFKKQDGVIFCTPDDKQAFGFVYCRK